jgi:hypothetical protein
MSGTLHQTAAQALLSGADPFADRVSGDVWRPPATHVPGLNSGVRASILREVETVARDPGHRSRGLLVIGEAGAGKTHTLSTLLAHDLAGRASFVCVHHYASPGRLMHHIAVQVLTCLRRVLPGEDRAQLELLLEAASQAVGEPLPGADDDAAAVQRKVRTLAAALAARDPELDRSLLRVLLRAVLPDQAQRVSEWLSGHELDPADRTAIGARARPVDADDAFEAVASLARLAQLHRPLLICLDQTEGLKLYDEPPLSAAGALVSLLCRLHDRVPGCVLCVTCLRDVWASEYQPRMHASERARIMERREELEPLDPASAQAMITGRLATALPDGVPLPYPTWPFHPELLTSALPVGPRELLELCSQQLQRMRERGGVSEMRLLRAGAPRRAAASAAAIGPEAPGSAEAVGELWAKALRRSLDEVFEVSEDAVRVSLERIMSSLVGSRVPGGGRLVELQRAEVDARPLDLLLGVQPGDDREELTWIGLAVSEAFAQGFATEMRKLESLMDEGAVDRLVLVRDGAIKGSWKAGLSAYEGLVSRGMRHARLGARSRRALAAVQRILTEAEAGDLVLHGKRLRADGLMRRLAAHGVLEKIPLVAAVFGVELRNGESKR